jgi:predicted nucleotidyltransferase
MVPILRPASETAQLAIDDDAAEGGRNFSPRSSMSTKVTPTDTARHLRHLVAERHRRAAGRARRLRQGLPAAAQLLGEIYGARRVVLFGSLATGSVSETSDVDLAVEGLPGPRYFAALSDLMALLACPVDLIRIEEAPESLRQRIAAEGEVL